MTQSTTIMVYTDVLCVWAYVSQIRIDELKKHFGSQVQFEYRFIPVFGCTENRIGEGWKEKDGYSGFNRHVRSVCDNFPHVEIHPDIWLTNRPRSSSSSHLFIKAIQIWSQKNSNNECDASGNSLIEEYIWNVREAFFKHNRDISHFSVLSDIARQIDIPSPEIMELIDSGEAIAQLCLDIEKRDQHRIQGSPTYCLNEYRQKLYGNVGYRILEANVQEVLETGNTERASWC